MDQVKLEEIDTKLFLLRCGCDEVIELRTMLMKVVEKYNIRGVKVKEITLMIKAFSAEKISEKLKIPHERQGNILVF